MPDVGEGTLVLSHARARAPRRSLLPLVACALVLRRLTRCVGVVWEWAQKEARETLKLLQALPADVSAELVDALLE